MMTQWLYTITSTHTLMSYRVGVGKDSTSYDRKLLTRVRTGRGVQMGIQASLDPASHLFRDDSFPHEPLRQLGKCV